MAVDFALADAASGEVARVADAAPARQAPRLVNADVRALPLKAGSVGLVWSNLMLHWLDDPLPALRELHRVLEVGGLLTFAMLGPDTLKELRTAHGATGDTLRRFPDMHDMGDMLVAAGFADPVMDMEMITFDYRRPRQLLADQRHLGVRDGLLGRRAGATGGACWRLAVRRDAGCAAGQLRDRLRPCLEAGAAGNSPTGAP
jgi:malonyl-CoA O-methyltransferase